jgi:LmbE family N-acetylglucosaminyl deacetylase
VNNTLNDRHIGANSTPTSRWARWLGSAPVPAIELDELLTPQTRLVVVAPHPDDEVLACGGLLQLHVERGGACTVIAVTDGEASHGDTSKAARMRLAADRRDESERGLARLRVHPDAVVRLGLPDGDVPRHAEHLASRLQPLLRIGDLVVSTWHLDGHPDHDTTGRVAEQAAHRAGARFMSAPIWMWHWSFPDDMRVPWRSLRRLRLPDAALALKLAALDAHRTQLADRGAQAGPVLDAPLLQRAAQPDEFFFV